MSRLHRLELRHPDGTTPIVVGEGAARGALPKLSSWLEGRTLFVVTTPRVEALHGGDLEPLEALAARAVRLSVPDGEGAKSLAEAERLWRSLLAAGGKRDSVVVTFGGGSVGDLGGFVAGCFLRGVPFIQLPTTLLAQVDASIGGKTGLDLPEGKNTVGLFHQPLGVVSDIHWLSTLPVEEVRSGLMEVVKAGFLLDPGLFEFLETSLSDLLEGSAEVLTAVVARAAAAKVRVVEEDPLEGDRRRLLNFGHTLGHALEAAHEYQGLRHGEAVGYGMVFALRLARRLWGEIPGSHRLIHMVARAGLPPLTEVDRDELLEPMARDKKHGERGWVWVLPRGLGKGECVGGVPLDLVREELERFLRQPLAFEL